MPEYRAEVDLATTGQAGAKNGHVQSIGAVPFARPGVSWGAKAAAKVREGRGMLIDLLRDAGVQDLVSPFLRDRLSEGFASYGGGNPAGLFGKKLHCDARLNGFGMRTFKNAGE